MRSVCKEISSCYLQQAAFNSDVNSCQEKKKVEKSKSMALHYSFIIVVRILHDISSIFCIRMSKRR